MTQTTIRGGRRMSTAVCYLDPARSRPNLKIQANALTGSLLFDGKRCVGVRYSLDGAQHEARAEREVILSAGSINSPQLLELSGIGRPEVLHAAGIEVRHELRGVGENLRDHYSPRMKWAVPHALRMTYNTRTRGLGMARQALRYATTRKGLLGLPAAPIRAYVRTRPGLEAPDAAISWIPFLVGDNFQLAKDSGVTAIMNILRSESTGSIRDIALAADAAGGPLQFPHRSSRPRGDARGDAHRPSHHGGAADARHRERRDRSRR